MIHDQKFHDIARLQPPILLAIHLQRADRFEHRRPVNIVVRRAHIAEGGEQHEVLDIQNARRLIGAFQLAAEPHEMPSLIVGHGGIGNALEQVRTQPKLPEKFRVPFVARH